MMCFEPCLPPHAYLNSGLPGASPSILPFLFLAIDLLLSTCLKEQMALLPLHTAPSYLMSPLLAHILRIIAPTLLPPQSPGVQWAGCVAWGCVGAAVSTPRALGGSFQDLHLPSFTGQTGSISSPGLTSCYWVTLSMWRLLSVCYISSLSPSSYKPKMTQFGMPFFWAMNFKKLFSFSWQWLSPREIK